MENRQLTKEQEAKIQDVQELVEQGSAMTVRNADSHKAASELFVLCQTKKREIEDMREYQLEPIRDAKRDLEVARKRTIAFFQRPLDPLAAVMSALDRKMVSWRREERHKAEVIAQRKRAAEQKKIDAQKRKQEKIAEGLEKKGLDDEAAEIRDRIEMAPSPAAVEVAPRIETAQGANIKIVKVAEVNEQLQFALLAQAIEAFNKNQEKQNSTARIVPASYWTLNRRALDDYGQKTDGQVAVPGVRWVEDESTGARRRR